VGQASLLLSDIRQYTKTAPKSAGNLIMPEDGCPPKNNKIQAIYQFSIFVSPNSNARIMFSVHRLLYTELSIQCPISRNKPTIALSE
jgi:hypothetical protein